MNKTHARLAATAVKLIAKNGRSVTLRKFTETGPSYNPVQSAVDVSVVAVNTTFSAQDLSNTLIEGSDTAFLLDAAVDPNEYTKLIDGTKEYDIITTLNVQPGDTPIIYKIAARV